MEDSPKREIKQGRRAGNLFQTAGSNASTNESNNNASKTEASSSLSPRPARKQGGWADDIKEKKRGKFGRMLEEEDERLKQDATVVLDNDGDDIPIIPELDDVTEDDMASQVAAPPSVLVTRIATYKELDHDFEKHTGLLTLDGDIDLKLLGNVLAPESEIQEADKSWNWDRVFTEVSSELRSEWEQTKSLTSSNKD
ncbi:intraflagellar transport protein 43 homolog A-like isoform X2 [Clytia hemisphaerica]|uniref:Intraflagellar transport protein 43 n=1 Tax=Clytia hemisphaerica TaxID=252671 RepID=A0A7M5XJ30_9CNID